MLIPGMSVQYDKKNALVAANQFYDRVIPFFEQHDLKFMHLLTDRGIEYCSGKETRDDQSHWVTENLGPH